MQAQVTIARDVESSTLTPRRSAFHAKDDDEAPLPKQVKREPLIKELKRRRRMIPFVKVFPGVLAHTVLLLIVAFLQRDVHGSFLMQHSVEETLLGYNYNLITDTDSFWKWFEADYIPYMFNDHWYNDDLKQGIVKDTLLYTNHILGGFRLLLHRVKEHTCTKSPRFETYIPNCWGKLRHSTETHEAFGPPWNTTKYQASKDHGVWGFRVDFDIDAAPKIGGHAELKRVLERRRELYGNDDHIVRVLSASDASLTTGNTNTSDPTHRQVPRDAQGNFLKSEARLRAEAKIAELKSDRFIDLATREVILDFTLYNHNVNKFLATELRFHVEPTGFIRREVIQSAFNVEPYVSDLDHFRLACEIVFILLTGLFTLYEVWLAYRKTKKGGVLSYISFWTGVHILQLSFCWALIFMWIHYMDDYDRKSINLPAPHFLNLQPLGEYLLDYARIIMFTMFLFVMRMLEALQFSDEVVFLTDTMARAWPKLQSFSLLFFFVYFMFSLMGMVVFGPRLEAFSTVEKSANSCFELITGEYPFHSLLEVDRTSAIIFYYCYMFLIFFLLVNVFIAIVADAYLALSGERKEFEIPNFRLPLRAYAYELARTPRKHWYDIDDALDLLDDPALEEKDNLSKDDMQPTADKLGHPHLASQIISRYGTRPRRLRGHPVQNPLSSRKGGAAYLHTGGPAAEPTSPVNAHPSTPQSAVKGSGIGSNVPGLSADDRALLQRVERMMEQVLSKQNEVLAAKADSRPPSLQSSLPSSKVPLPGLADTTDGEKQS